MDFAKHLVCVVSGLGFALCYTPAIVMVGCYFRQRKALAYGIAMSGSGIGTFVLAPVVQLLIELYSWRGALLVLSAFVANLCVCGALLRPITLREAEEEKEAQVAELEKPGWYPTSDRASLGPSKRLMLVSVSRWQVLVSLWTARTPSNRQSQRSSSVRPGTCLCRRPCYRESPPRWPAGGGPASDPAS